MLARFTVFMFGTLVASDLLYDLSQFWVLNLI
jgi:hypothetical protein